MSGKRLRVLLDGTPLLDTRTGIGRYTASLFEELATVSDVDSRVMAFSLRGWRRLRGVLPHGTRARGLPVAARLLRKAWTRSDFPPVELFAGFGDVVHGTNFVLPPTVRSAGVLTIHDLGFLHAPERLADSDAELPELVRAGARRARAICTPSAAVANTVIEELDVDPGRVTVTPLGVDPAWFTARPPDPGRRARLGLPDTYLLFIGAAGPRKGLDWLARAHDTAGDLPPLVYAGPGEFPHTEGGRRTGYLSELDLHSVLAGARALVLPSAEEGFGLPVLEAMACGVPVVCSDVPALREVSTDPASGEPLAELVPYGDVDALAGTLREVGEEPPGVGASALRRAHAASYTWRRCARATVTAYRKATGTAPEN